MNQSQRIEDDELPGLLAALADVTEQAYAYASGSPTDYIDPTGLLSFGDIGNAIAGWGDNLTFGGTKRVRQLIGNDNVDYCSGAYAAGSVGGVVTSVAVPIGGLANAALVARVGRGVSARGMLARLADETGSFSNLSLSLSR